MPTKQKKVVTFGEIMLRLTTPGFQRIIQANELVTSFAGAEATVAVNLTNWGIPSKYLTVLPDNVLGDKCMNDLSQYRVDLSDVIRNNHRLGSLFIEKGSAQRGSMVVYDRENSATALTNLSAAYFKQAFDGCDWFHYTGITPALSETSLNNCKRAITEACNAGLTISTDLNYRNKLWNYGVKASEIMPELVAHSDIIIGNEEDAIQALGIKNQKIDVQKNSLPQEAYQTIALQLFDTNPKLKLIAFTMRGSINANCNKWSALIFTREEVYKSPEYTINNIVDRVGAGDCFASGLIYGLRILKDHQTALNFAVAASCLKHTIEGDYCLANINEIEALVNGNQSGRIVR